MQRAERSIRVAAPVSDVYNFWRDFENFPAFMEHVEAVTYLDVDGRASHWKLKGPLGTSVEFDARMTHEEPNRSIGWNSTGGSIETSGEVTFTDLADNTQVHVVMQWADPPGGAVGEAASRLLMDPEGRLEKDLQRFKDIVEGRIGSGMRR
ncbi:MAG TPA: SRPBCC family protein [Chloroflexota bacterium]|nr:SRPBCC family protein [Chloroflexota bacterium]